MQHPRTTPMFAAFLSAALALGGGNSLYAAVGARGVDSADISSLASFRALPNVREPEAAETSGEAIPAPLPRTALEGVPFRALRPDSRRPANYGGAPDYRWRSAVPLNAGRPGGFSRTVNFLGKFYGHAPSQTHPLPGQRQEMHGRAVGLRVRF